MKRFIAILAFCFSLCSLFSCTKEEDTEYGSLKCTIGKVTPMSVTVSVTAETPTNISGYYVGVCVSEGDPMTDDNRIMNNVDAQLGKHDYSISVSKLSPETDYNIRTFVQAGNGGLITWGKIKSFKTPSIRTILWTAPASDVKTKEATLSAVLDLTDCIYESIEYGFALTPMYWDDPYKVKSTNLSGKKYSLKLDDLFKACSYKCMAYVTIGRKTYYANEVTFVTDSLNVNVNLKDASDITNSKATISGSLKINSKESFSKGAALYYSSSASTLSDLKSVGTSKTLSLSNNGSFSEQLSGLSYDTQYYYAVVAWVDGCDYASEVMSFKTDDLKASVTLNEASSISEHKATVSYSMNREYEGDFKRYDTLYYSSSASTLSALKAEGVAVRTVWPYSARLSGLSPGTQYYYGVVVYVEDREFVSEVKSFTTASVSATVSLSEATEITEHKTTIGGILSVSSIENFTKTATLYYSSNVSTMSALMSNGTSKTLSLADDGSFSEQLSDLACGTQYNYVVVAQVDGKEFASDIKSFTTASFSVSVSLSEATKITEFEATIGGVLSVSSIETLTKSATLYYSSKGSTLSALKTGGTAKSLSLASDGSFSVQLPSLSYDTQYYYVLVARVDNKEFATEVKLFRTNGFPEMVDLGLSVKWRSWNLGASKPEEYGLYYQWGDTQGYEYGSGKYFYWKDKNGNVTYKWCKGSDTTLTKYNTNSSYGTVDNKEVLEIADDAARAALGGKWRTPTKDEFDELMKNTSFAWSTVNGINGIILWSKISGYTDKCLFLPSAGYLREDYIREKNSYGSYGYYMCSSLIFDSRYEEVNGSTADCKFRCDGVTIRPVCE